MTIKYDSRREALSEVISRATTNATYVVPDLQRPYVWAPSQVILLIDSLFRGWPFGSLLVWEVKPDCFDTNEGIPHRPFWQVVDRTSEDAGTTTSPLGQPATYQMVLDGQQRVQSLIIALGGDQWGFQLPDSDWAQDVQGRRVKPSDHWSRASLCVSLEKFQDEYVSKNGKARKIEVRNILEWVILDREHGQSKTVRPANYVCPLDNAWDNPGKYIRLSRLWDLAQKDFAEDETMELLVPLLAEHKVLSAETSPLLTSLAQFMSVIANVKSNSFVHALQIESFQVSKQWTKDDYSDAIVNIFTRLNTAGRTLSREEITLAWLKVGWLSRHTDGQPAGQCLEELKDRLSDRGFSVDIDDVVRLISFAWAVQDRAGNLLDSKDLLKGDIIRALATRTSERWKTLLASLEAGADLIKSRELPEKSFNAVIVFLCWRLLVDAGFNGLPKQGTREHDSLEKQLVELNKNFADRWFLSSEWAGVWAEGAVLNFQNFAKDLSDLHEQLRVCSAKNFIEVVVASVAKLMSRVEGKALQHIENLVVKDRRRVQAYYSLLWIWHRLDAVRWRHSSVPMRTGRKRSSKLEVDHTVADAWWQSRVDFEIAQKQAGADADAVVEPIAPDGFENISDARTTINLVGNCSLLEKSFNISKSADPLWSFLREVKEFKEGLFNRESWQSSLLLEDAMTMPEEVSLSELKAAIQRRDAAIRSELIEFVKGTKQRTDVE